MDFRGIPIRNDLAAADEEAIDYLPMPREMATFEMPRCPEPGPDHDVAGARDVLVAFVERMDSWLAGGGPLPAFELKGLEPESLRVLNETLGEGEVAAVVEARPAIRIQETVFPGIWREQHVGDDGVLLHDYLLAAPIPPVVAAIAVEAASPRLRDMALPVGAMNVPALLHELQEAMDRAAPSVPAHAINLTLLPLSPEDTSHLDRVLDGGTVAVLSRGFGNCRIGSTAARHVWRVQYFNNMETLILNTIEVTPMPETAIAARDDIVESRGRLADLAAWMGESLTTP
jgi:hydrogenase-1 operon protein HyaF